MGFLQYIRAFLAADFDDLAADRYFDAVILDRIIAGGTGSFGHDDLLS
jgi:hypothetical protein